MKSAWFWGTDLWESYQQDYFAGRERPVEFKTSPLADDHDFTGLSYSNLYEQTAHQTQVLDLRTHQWSDIRKSYHSIIHRGRDVYDITRCTSFGMYDFKRVHIEANGRQPRPDSTYEDQAHWVKKGNGLLVGARDDQQQWQAFSLWILYQGNAYFASAPSLQRNVQLAVIWESLCMMKTMGITLVEMGQTDGTTEKEKNIGFFKAGWGGKSEPFTILRRGP